MTGDLSTIGPAALAALATGAGAPLWAGIIMTIINTIKAIPEAARLVAGHERLAAFSLSGVVVVIAYVTALGMVPPSAEVSPFGIFLAVLAWFSVGRLAMAFHDDIAAKPNSLTGTSTG